MHVQDYNLILGLLAIRWFLKHSLIKSSLFYRRPNPNLDI